MNYILLPSLEHIALIKTVITLWNQEDITALIQQYFAHESDDRIFYKNEWQAVENNVQRKVPQLSLPNVLREKISCFIKPIGLEILLFLVSQEPLYYLGMQPLNELSWTPQGTIDAKKTVQTYIKYKKLDIKHLYMLACNNCIEEEIPKLWDNLSECHRKQFSSSEYVSLERALSLELVLYWTHVTLGKSYECVDLIWNGSSPAYQKTLKAAAFANRRDATKYFFQKLNSRERRECFANYSDYILTLGNANPFRFNDVLCFLLPLLDKEEEIEILQKSTFNVLNGCLKWPWQTFFMEVANRMWDFLSKRECYTLLFNIADPVSEGLKDYDYQNLLKQFWQQMPEAHKRYIVNDIITRGPHLLSKLLRIKDFENFYIILREATLEECIKMFSYKCDLRKERFGNNGKFHSLPFIIQMFLSSSTSNKVQFVKEIKERILLTHSNEKMEEDEGIWNSLLRRLYYQTLKNKRAIEEVEASHCEFKKKKVGTHKK